MPRYARTERAALAQLMIEVGPDAPTVNEGWVTRDLAAHLVVRERRPDAAAGILLPPLRGYGERVRRRIAAGDWAALVDQVRRPPVWSPVSNPLVDEVTNTMEFFIHHEDVRRGGPRWEPRDLPTGLEGALWRRVSPMARLALRNFPAALTIRAPGHGKVEAGGGGEPVEVVGTPGELVIFFSGRQRVSRVEVDGDPEAAGRLRTASLGF
ncbi:TIGR03085 family metal-binding protein [Micromonospora sp. SH-82]|uniref:TIGR03085 family metal-binding protein n=1 Tax=Micromonospora sp. SH-82 TaxID=3132938 RepID=UPI003EB8B54D